MALTFERVTFNMRERNIFIYISYILRNKRRRKEYNGTGVVFVKNGTVILSNNSQCKMAMLTTSLNESKVKFDW